MIKHFLKFLICSSFMLLTVTGVWAGDAKKAVICDTGKSIMLENRGAKDALKMILANVGGYEVSEVSDPGKWSVVFDDPDTALVVYGQCEVVSQAVAAKIKPFLKRGGIIITGGGMPFNYITDKSGKFIARDLNAMNRVAAISGCFISGATAKLTDAGKRIFCGKKTVPAGVRAISGTAPENILIPLATVNNASSIAVVGYPGNGRLLYTGSQAIDRSALNPMGGVAVWRNLLDFLKTALPEVDVKLTREKLEIGKDKEIEATFILKNPSKREIVLNARGILSKEKTFGTNAADKTVLEKEFNIAPGQTVNYKFTFPMPSADKWGVYALSFSCDLGVRKSTCFHVFPPAAVSYIDINPIYPENPDQIRKVTVGLRSFLPVFNATLKLETQKYSGGEWKTAAEKQVSLTKTALSNIKTFSFDIAPVKNEDLRIRASICGPDGKVIHDSYNRIEYSDHNRALDRRITMFRAFNGIQFITEGQPFINNLLEWRKEMPLFRGLQPFELPKNSRQWMKDHDFTCNYGGMLTEFPNLSRWKLDDCNGAGVSAEKYMPGHHEDVSAWLVKQHSRSHFHYYTTKKPDIINLVEAVAGYEPPGLPNRIGLHSHFLGYTPRAIPNFRDALSGRDAGVRMLNPGGKTAKRYHFKELYELTYNEPMPTPGELGFKSWDEYVPMKLTLTQEGGYFQNNRNLLRYRIHYYLRSYLHMQRLDDLTVNTRAFVPEIHCVIGSDGPLLGQVSSQYYRLPYIDTHTRWLFRSAYVHARGVTFGGERAWLETAKRFGRRVGDHEEIGGGQLASYRTAETSFVSLFTKRSALPYKDLQVDFYHAQAKKYRVKEEKAMFRGFQLAYDSGSKPYTDNAQVLFIGNNNSYYPSNYRGNYRWDLRLPKYRILTYSDFAIRNGIPFHSIGTPIWDTALLAKYRIVGLMADRYMKGDLKVIGKWLHEPGTKGRTLIINHAGPLQIDYRMGFGLDSIMWKSTAGWRELGLDITAPKLIYVKGLGFAGTPVEQSSSPMNCLYVKPPKGAKVLVRDDKNRAIVWQAAVGGNRVIYSGLPMNNIYTKDDPRNLNYNMLRHLYAYLKCPSISKTVPEDWFSCGYRLKDGRLALAFINPGEQKMSMGYYGNTGDAIEKAAAKLGMTDVKFTWYKAGKPGKTYKLRDAWTGKLLPETITADKNGNINFNHKINVAKLYILE